MARTPERSANLARPRDAGRVRSKFGELRTVEAGVEPVKWPRAKSSWSGMAKEAYRAARESPTSALYTEADVFALRLLCDELTAYQAERPMKDRHGEVVLDGEGRPVMVSRRSPEMLKALTSLMGDLAFTEGARRRIRVEIERGQAEEPDYAAIARERYGHLRSTSPAAEAAARAAG